MTRRKTWIAGLFAAALVCLALVLPQNAWGMALTDLVGLSPTEFLAGMLIGPLASFMTDVLAPFTKVMFDWGTDFMSIPYVNKIILALQVISMTGVVALRVWTAISDHILSDRGGPGQAGEYIVRSILSLLAVALMPTICRLVIQFGKQIYEGITSMTGGVEESMAWFSLEGADMDALMESTDILIVWLLLGIIVMLLLTIACGFQFVRRQVDMLTVAIIAPIVSVFAGSEDNSYQVNDMLRSLFGLVCQQWLQYVLVMVAMGFAQSFIAGSVQGFTAGAGDFNAFAGEGVKNFMFCLATFGAALTIPALVDRYTFGTAGSRAGAAATGALVSTMVRKVI